LFSSCCDEQNGVGEFSVEYNGAEEIFNNRFEGAQMTFEFGCGTNSGGGGGGNTDPVCGNGIVETGEECDDGNQANQDGCSSACKTARCGDGIRQNGEQCDDGNSINNDSCTNECKNPSCGDGIVQPGEDCDDGNRVNQDSCTNACKTPRCGDGIVQSNEDCDDGNTNGGDGCSSSCQNEGGGGGDSNSDCPSGQVQVSISFTTDRWAWSENQVYFFDETMAGDEFYWYHPARSLQGNKQYAGSVCVEPSGCYKFYFFDTYGDGLEDGFVDLKWNGATVLAINPGDTAPRWEDDADGSTIYWYKELGSC
jgi:cysteine-rich repeat protein